MKHEPIVLTLRELLERMDGDVIGERMGIGKIVHDGCCDDNSCPGFREYSVTELSTKIRVSWPEHVVTPKFNGDANYQFD